MIISHKYKFIFVKTQKTASTSLEIALSKYCGKDDILTPLDKCDEKIRKNLGYRGAQNYQSGFKMHMTASMIMALLDKNIYRNYFKFCFERNPYEKVISCYYMLNKKEPRPTISEWITLDKDVFKHRFGIQYYCNKEGDMLVDRICKYENMNHELEYLAKELELPEVPLLPYAKANNRKNKNNYNKILTGYEKEIIYNILEDQFLYLEYDKS